MNPGLLLALLLCQVAIAGGTTATVPDPDDERNAIAVIERVAPKFPSLPLQARISATVSVDVTLSGEGHPVAVTSNVTSSNMALPSAGISAMFQEAAEAAALEWRFASVPPKNGTRRLTIEFIFTSKQNDGPVENNEQKAQREVVVKGPLTLEVIESQYVCYTPGESTVR